VIAEDDRVVERATVRATMARDYAGMPASGRTAVTRVVDGKIVEHWTVGDQPAMLVQLGFGPGQ
jgi:predicted ester cyclase